jgi:hypothetical protein
MGEGIRMLAVLLATLLGPAAHAHAAAAPAAHGPGKLLSRVLIYRDKPDYIASAGYVVFFRTRGAFAGHTADGTTVPGELTVVDASDDHDGYAGSIGAGRPTGRCYWWTLPGAPRIDRAKTAAKLPVTLTLHGTAPQRRTTTLRRLPAGYDSGTWSKSPAIERDLAKIGCHVG